MITSIEQITDELLRNGLPLAWLQSKAAALGLVFTQQPALSGLEYRAPLTDSFAKFMFGVYRLLRFGKRFLRPIGAGRRPVKGGWSEPINEWIDDSVFDRWRDVAQYRPQNLAAWAANKNVDPGAQRGDIRA